MQHTKQISINGKPYEAVTINPSDIVTGRGRLYLFYGIHWQQLDREPRDMQIERLRIDDQRYWCRPVEKWEIDTKRCALYFFWNNQWYEGVRIPVENLNKVINN